MIDFAAWPLTGIATLTQTALVRSTSSLGLAPHGDCDSYMELFVHGNVAKKPGPSRGLRCSMQASPNAQKGPPDLEVLLLHT